VPDLASAQADGSWAPVHTKWTPMSARDGQVLPEGQWGAAAATEEGARLRHESFLQEAKRDPSLLQEFTAEKAPDYLYPQHNPATHAGARPKYLQNAPCDYGVQNVAQSNTWYQILPGIPWPVAVPPAESKGTVLNYCSAQMSEVAMGFGQTPMDYVKMTGDWCGWQSSVASWVGRKGELGHPDWNFRNCNNMKLLVAFALRDVLSDKGGWGSSDICARMILSTGPVKRYEQLVKDAWAFSARSLEGGRMAITTAVSDAGMKELMRKAQEYADQLYGKLRGQKEMFDDINGAKQDMAAFDNENVMAAPPQEPQPGLPDSADFAVLVQTSTSLRPWGRSAH